MAVSIDPALLVGLVVGGVSLVVATTHWLGGSEEALLTDTDDARRRYTADHGGLTVEAILGDDGRAALIGLESGPPGLVFTQGSHVVTRPAGAVVSVQVDDDGLVLRLADFSSPRPIRLGIADAEERQRWLLRLQPHTEGA